MATIRRITHLVIEPLATDPHWLNLWVSPAYDEALRALPGVNSVRRFGLPQAQQPLAVMVDKRYDPADVIEAILRVVQSEPAPEVDQQTTLEALEQSWWEIKQVVEALTLASLKIEQAWRELEANQWKPSSS
jgi:hypothetical protein